jgi:hypothetical protein
LTRTKVVARRRRSRRRTCRLHLQHLQPHQQQQQQQQVVVEVKGKKMRLSLGHSVEGLVVVVPQILLQLWLPLPLQPSQVVRGLLQRHQRQRLLLLRLLRLLLLLLLRLLRLQKEVVVVVVVDKGGVGFLFLLP